MSLDPDPWPDPAADEGAALDLAVVLGAAFTGIFPLEPLVPCGPAVAAAAAAGAVAHLTAACLNLCKSTFFRPLLKKRASLAPGKTIRHKYVVCAELPIMRSKLFCISLVMLCKFMSRSFGEIALGRATPLAVLTGAADAPPSGLARTHTHTQARARNQHLNTRQQPKHFKEQSPSQNISV